MIVVHVVIAGGHGKIALRLQRLLSARGDSVIGLVRNQDHLDEVADTGAQAVLCDLEQASVSFVADTLDRADAVVFAAGAGPGSGAARKDTVDRAAAVLLADASVSAGVRRYLLVSSMGVDRATDPGIDEVFAAYLRAKKAAEEELRTKDLDWAVLRPGSLTDEPGTGLVRLASSTEPGSISRDDVASVLLGLLDRPELAGVTAELVNGSTPIPEALAAL
ncbi:NADH(P)-binding [Actinoalloteichus sp. GBA129-24]|uniref:NADH(P)-binding n=1 Tax=Actinoalloteichus fjordicus TaxID=1612552 RepID=A0AAC9L776_9PSEU|nr:NADH(P)-binding [Actinoalloteichus fjordicus]APU18088.1 NADH(P)-binding [Actinoalloteichus sp. GBA129-24]